MKIEKGNSKYHKKDAFLKQRLTERLILQLPLFAELRTYKFFKLWERYSKRNNYARKRAALVRSGFLGSSPLLASYASIRHSIQQIADYDIFSFGITVYKGE